MQSLLAELQPQVVPHLRPGLLTQLGLDLLASETIVLVLVWLACADVTGAGIVGRQGRMVASRQRESPGMKLKVMNCGCIKQEPYLPKSGTTA